MQGLGNTAWSVATLRCDDTPLLDALAAQALRTLYDARVTAGAVDVDSSAATPAVVAPSGGLALAWGLPLAWAFNFFPRSRYLQSARQLPSQGRGTDGVLPGAEHLAGACQQQEGPPG